MKTPTRLKKMKLNSVDLVRRGANPEAHIALHKSYDGENEGVDVAKAEQDLTLFTDVLGESFSSIMKDDTLSQEEKIGMVVKSMDEFTDTLGDYLTSSFSILEKSNEKTTVATQKPTKSREGESETMKTLVNVDKSLLSPEEATQLDALLAKACKTEKSQEELEKEKAGKVNPAKAQEEAEKDADLPPAVQKALQEVDEMKKSYEMRELEGIAKKYEVLGKKAPEEAKILYDLKKSGEGNYNAYIAALDAQVSMVEKSGLFAEIGKSGNFNYTSVAKSDPEKQIESIAKSYREKDASLSEAEALAKAWENNPELFDAYEQSVGL